jgi:hypothetical protein
MTSGSLKNGVISMQYKDYLSTLEGYEIIMKTEFLKPHEYQLALDYIKAVEGWRYEWEVFFWHAIKIFTGRYYGKEKLGRMACVKQVINTINATGKYNLDVNLNNYEFQELWNIT